MNLAYLHCILEGIILHDIVAMLISCRYNGEVLEDYQKSLATYIIADTALEVRQVPDRRSAGV